jgi:hypothetical protein
MRRTRDACLILAALGVALLACKKQPPADERAVGVAACDELLKKREACVASYPPAAQPGVREHIEQTRVGWKQAAATAEGRAALEAGCAQVLKGARSDAALCNPNL